MAVRWLSWMKSSKPTLAEAMAAVVVEAAAVAAAVAAVAAVEDGGRVSFAEKEKGVSQ